MAIVATDWTIDRGTGEIAYTGADHNGTSPSYATVIEFHRWLQDLADDASYTVASGDELDITDSTPSDRSTDNIITLINGFYISDATAEHLYDGSIIQNGGADIYDGIVNFGGPTTMIQIIQNGALAQSGDDWWNYSVGGTDDTSTAAAFLTDSGESWTTNEWVGYTIVNVTDGSRGLITANTATTITANLYGGSGNNWDNGDAYLIAKGLNGNATAGISHRFMLKVRASGSDIDGRRLVGISRRLYRTYSEFKINGTNRGNNVLALSDASDLNNTTAASTINGWSDITNTEAYSAIDVNNDTVNEYYYSSWDRGSRTINQFYERMKFLTRDGSAATLYGLSGEIFRGITHQVAYGSLTGTFDEGNLVSWSGTNSGTGQVLADDGSGNLWMQLLTGVAPVNGDSLSQSSPDAASATASSSTEATVSTPFCGASTGSALIGAYGFGIEYVDLSSADIMTALDGTARSAPNNVTFTVSGVIADEDYVLVGPETGGTFDFTQLTLNTTLSGASESAVVVTTAIPTDTPSSGTIRVETDAGQYRRLGYSSWTSSTFTLDTTYDFSTDNATATSRSVMISYIDALADSTPIAAASLVDGTEYIITTVGTTTWTSYGATTGSLGEIFTMASGPASGTGFAKPRSTQSTFTVVYASPRALFIRVRDGGTDGDLEGIKTFETTGTLGSGGGSTTAIRTADV